MPRLSGRCALGMKTLFVFLWNGIAEPFSVWLIV